jgi:Dolichyl-phosphate-mannose-protein mannosyltransferase
MPMWPRVAAFALISAGFVLRVARLDLIEFKADEQEALNLGIQLLSDRPWSTFNIPQHGMLSSQHIANAPLFNWVMALFWALTPSPVGATALVAIVNSLTLYPLWKWAERRVDGQRALLLLAIMAVSPFAVLFSRKLWAQNLLFPGLVGLLWAIERVREQKWWQVAILFGTATLVVGQLHQSGPIALTLLPVALCIDWLMGRRAGTKAIKRVRPSRIEFALLAGVLALNAFFWIPYLAYLIGALAEGMLNRPTVASYEPALLIRVMKQIAPMDLFYAFGPDRDDFLTEPTRRIIYYVAVGFGAPLAGYGLWRWMRAPRQLPVLGIWWWLIVAAFTLTKIPTYPFYVLVLSPLPAALAAGAFDGGRFQSSLVESVVLVWRWTYVAALCALTISGGMWIAERGGSRGDYGIIYAAREAQAKTLIGANLESQLDGRQTIANDIQPSDCHPLPVEVQWIARWLHAGEGLPETAAICDAWTRGSASVYEWRVRR